MAIEAKNFRYLFILSLLIIVGVIWAYPFLLKTRFLWRIIIGYVLICSAVYVIFANKNLPTICKVSLIIIILSIYCPMAYFASLKPIWPITLKLNQMKSKLEKGCYYEIEDELKKKPFYMFSTVEKYNWTLLQTSLAERLNQHRNAYEIYIEIDENDLIETELVALALRKIPCLIQLGDYKRAEILFRSIEERITDKNTLRFLFYRSLLLKTKGKFKEAIGTLLEAIANYDGDLTKSIILIYNNIQ